MSEIAIFVSDNISAFVPSLKYIIWLIFLVYSVRSIDSQVVCGFLSGGQCEATVHGSHGMSERSSKSPSLNSGEVIEHQPSDGWGLQSYLGTLCCNVPLTIQ